MSFLKNIWKSNSKHQKLSEELALQGARDRRESWDATAADRDAVTFKLKYLGSTVIEKVSGDDVAQQAVKSILKSVKAQKRKPQRVHFSASLRGVAVADAKGDDVLRVSIYRISNCCTDRSHPQVFSFTSTDVHETTECHAFSCGKRKFAETVALTVARAFATAYDEWRILPSTREFEAAMGTRERRGPAAPAPAGDADRQLIEFEEDEEAIAEWSPSGLELQRPWVSFEDEMLLKPQSVK